MQWFAALFAMRITMCCFLDGTSVLAVTPGSVIITSVPCPGDLVRDATEPLETLEDKQFADDVVGGASQASSHGFPEVGGNDDDTRHNGVAALGAVSAFRRKTQAQKMTNGSVTG